MQLIRNLGSILLSPKHTKKSTCSEYLCPDCNKPTVHRTSDVLAGRVKRCKICTISHRRSKDLSKDSFNMELIGDIIYRLPHIDSTSGNQAYVLLKCPCCNEVREYQAVTAAKFKHSMCKRCRTAVKVVDGRKQCSTCKEEKNISEFFISKTSMSGLSYACKTCSSISSKKYELKVGKDFLSNKAMAKKYKITPKDVELLKSTEECGICHSKLLTRKEKHIDHNHLTGDVRGVLCSKCNQGLGLFKDSIQNLEGAIKWLQNNGLV